MIYMRVYRIYECMNKKADAEAARSTELQEKGNEKQTEAPILLFYGYYYYQQRCVCTSYHEKIIYTISTVYVHSNRLNLN